MVHAVAVFSGAPEEPPDGRKREAGKERHFPPRQLPLMRYFRLQVGFT
jgi:hypothetical protein